MSKFHRVVPGKYLHLPLNLSGRDRTWLKPGGVVDLEDPFIADTVKGQEYKLEPAPDAKQADPLPDGRLIRMRDVFTKRGGPSEPVKAEVLAAVGAEAAGEVQAPDPRPQRGSHK